MTGEVHCSGWTHRGRHTMSDVASSWSCPWRGCRPHRRFFLYCWRYLCQMMQATHSHRLEDGLAELQMANKWNHWNYQQLSTWMRRKGRLQQLERRCGPMTSQRAQRPRKRRLGSWRLRGGRRQSGRPATAPEDWVQMRGGSWTVCVRRGGGGRKEYVLQ